MLSVMLVAALAQAVTVATPPVPGGCSEPAQDNVGKSGCYASANLKIDRAPSQIHWHIYRFADAAAARREAGRHRWHAVVSSHGINFLYVLGPRRLRLHSGHRVAVIGPMHLPAGRTLVARFLEATFPPGMRTRVHSHPGPEAFYVVEGEQCMDTPAGAKTIPAGGTFIAQAGPHLQAAPAGRKNIAVVFYPEGQSWMQMETWQPSGFCDAPASQKRP